MKNYPKILALTAILLFATAGNMVLADGAAKHPKNKNSGFKIYSTSFQSGGPIPDQYTCQGKDISPEIQWKGAPADTQSYLLICEDPDASFPAFTHWVIFNIPNNVYELTENFPHDETMTNGITQGVNDFKNIGYGGPCPPSGTHRYFFKLYALDNTLDLGAGALKSQVLAAMKGHVLAWAQIMGFYGE